jgi:hypothetical protein
LDPFFYYHEHHPKIFIEKVSGKRNWSMKY